MSSRALRLWIAALFAITAAFIVHLTVRLETVRLGYELAQERKEQRHLLELRRMLRIESAVLTRVDRVNTFARGALRMRHPEGSTMYVLRDPTTRGAW